MLVYNILLVLVGMSLLGATLTLPGIAGIVLTIGMAIDASILILKQSRKNYRMVLQWKKQCMLVFLMLWW